MSAAGIRARNSTLLVAIVGRATPFQRITELSVKCAPVTVSVNAGPPALVLRGEKSSIEGIWSYWDAPTHPVIRVIKITSGINACKLNLSMAFPLMTLALISPFHVGDLKIAPAASSYLLRKGFGDATARRTKNGTGTRIVLRLFAWSCTNQVRIWRGRYLAGGTPRHWCDRCRLDRYLHAAKANSRHSWKIYERLLDARYGYLRVGINKVKVDDAFARLALAAPGTGGALTLARSATNQKDAMESTSADARSDRANAGIYSGYIARNAETRRNAADCQLASMALGQAELAMDLGNFTVDRTGSCYKTSCFQAQSL